MKMVSPNTEMSFFCLLVTSAYNLVSWAYTHALIQKTKLNPHQHVCKHVINYILRRQIDLLLGIVLVYRERYKMAQAQL